MSLQTDFLRIYRKNCITSAPVIERHLLYAQNSPIAFSWTFSMILIKFSVIRIAFTIENRTSILEKLLVNFLEFQKKITAFRYRFLRYFFPLELLKIGSEEERSRFFKKNIQHGTLTEI